MTFAERLTDPEFQLLARKHGAVREFLTEVEDELRRRDMNQAAFAKLIGKSPAWVSKVLRGRPNLTFFTAVELADALELDVRVEVIKRDRESPRRAAR